VELTIAERKLEVTAVRRGAVAGTSAHGSGARDGRRGGAVIVRSGGGHAGKAQEGGGSDCAVHYDYVRSRSPIK